MNGLSIIQPVNWLISHLRIPLYRNAYALVLGSAINSIMGLLYWVLAAHSYTTESLGVNSALITTMIFLANLSHFNLTNALNRFLPTAGRATARLVTYFYFISLSAALVSSFIFIFFIEVWAPELNFLKSNPYFILGFPLATMLWCIFALQDTVFVGLRRATWVPIENTIFAVLKIVLIISFVGLLPGFGIFVSWTLSVALLIVPVNLLIFRSLIPRHVEKTEGQAEPILPFSIVKFVAGDYFASLIGNALFFLLPLIILEKSGASANAYYYLSWTVAYSLYHVSQSMGMSLIAEAAADQAKLSIYSFRIFLQNVRLLTPAVAVMVLGAPYILRLFGKEYAAESVLLLRLLCLSALPNIITSVYLSIVRAQRRMKALILALTSLNVLVLSLSYILLETYGISGIGLAWLLSQTIVSAVLIITQLGRFWLPHLRLEVLVRMLAVPRGLWQHWRNRCIKADNTKRVNHILSVISPLDDMPHPTQWCIKDLIQTVNDVTVMTLGPRGQLPVAFLKLPRSSFALTSLRVHREVLACLGADPRLAKFHTLLPTVLAMDEAEEYPYLVERALPGIEAHRMLSDADSCLRMQSAAANAIGCLHCATASSVVVDAGILERWIDSPISIIKKSLASHKTISDYHQTLDGLAAELHDSLTGRTLSVSWVHGDFSPGNILLTSDASVVTGILDWDQAAPQDLPQLDLSLLFLTSRMLRKRCELGDVVREMLDLDEWNSHESDLLNAANKSLPDNILGTREMVLLTWLRHVKANLTKSNRYSGHWLWPAKNIEAVLKSLRTPTSNVPNREADSDMIS